MRNETTPANKASRDNIYFLTESFYKRNVIVRDMNQPFLTEKYVYDGLTKLPISVMMIYPADESMTVLEDLIFG